MSQRRAAMPLGNRTGDRLKPSWITTLSVAGSLLIGLGITGCGDDGEASPSPTQQPESPTPPNDSPTPCLADNDGDGSCDNADCNDTDASIYPGARDECGDLIDKNCDTLDGCEVDDDKDGVTELAGDCNDFDAAVYPGAAETCNDGTDQDCDGKADDGCPGADDDGDGYCEATTACADGSTPGDCNDADPANYPGNIEVFDGRDNNCDGAVEGRVSKLKAGTSYSVTGDSSSQQVGYALAGVRPRGSMVTPNGDTLADAIIGAPGYGGLDRGGAVILYGGQSWSNVTIPVSSMTSVLNEKLETTKAGFSVAGDFNLDFDEYMDFAVGAPFFDLSNADDAGNAYVYLGSGTPLTSTTTDVADVYVQGYVDSVKIGYSLAGGDITGDGIDDYLMGCPNRADNYSWVFVFPGSGAIGGKVESWQLSKISFIGRYVGQSIAFVGNSDGDAYGDFVIGGEMEDDTRPGVVTWVPGRESYKEQAWYVGFADAGAYQFVGDVAQENLGWSVAGEGDVNGDGSLDFIAGDEKTVDRTDPGAMLFMGGPEKFLNGSGAVVGTPISANSAANVHFFLGDNDSCPCSVALNGDMNGDGYSDILVGASESNTGNGNAGRVYVVLGRADLPSSIYLSTDAAYVLESVETGEKLGYSTTFVGDTNGDSFDDFVVGAPGGDFSSSVIDSGRTYMLFGFASR